MLKQKNAVLVAHYYTEDAIQELAEETGGIIADSLEMARFGANLDSKHWLLLVLNSWGKRLKY